MGYSTDKEMWQDAEVRLNLPDLELFPNETQILTLKAEKSETKESGNLIATNLRLIFRTNRRVDSAPWALTQRLHIDSDRLTVEITTSADWTFRFSQNTEGREKMDKIRNLSISTRALREVQLRASIVHNKQLDLLDQEKIISDLAGVWNVSGDAGNLGKLVITNFRVVWFGILQENSNVSVPHVAVKNAQVRNSKFGKILVIETSKPKGGAVLGFRMDPESLLEKTAQEIVRVIETAVKDPWLGFVDLVVESPRRAMTTTALEEKKGGVGLVSRVVAAGDAVTEEEYCEELGLMIKKLPHGVSYKTLWSVG